MAKVPVVDSNKDSLLEKIEVVIRDRRRSLTVSREEMVARLTRDGRFDLAIAEIESADLEGLGLAQVVGSGDPAMTIVLPGDPQCPKNASSRLGSGPRVFF